MNLKNQPDHISFIMDGNNRWSLKNNKNKFESYKKGAQNLMKISNYIFNKYKTNYISAFALSKHNLKRSKTFLNIFVRVIESLIDDFNKFKIIFRISFIGDLNFLPNEIINKLKSIESINKDSNKCLIIFINYSGKLDIHNSILKFKINKWKNLDKGLLTHNIPNPDLLFRTGGYQRISDFMLYQISFTELMFSSKLWPDLQNKDIDKIYSNYSNIERKFGI